MIEETPDIRRIYYRCLGEWGTLSIHHDPVLVSRVEFVIVQLLGQNQARPVGFQRGFDALTRSAHVALVHVFLNDSFCCA